MIARAASQVIDYIKNILTRNQNNFKNNQSRYNLKDAGLSYVLTNNRLSKALDYPYLSGVRIKLFVVGVII